MTTDAGAGGLLRIDLAALAENYRTLCGVVAPAGVAAVVKADGYGLGAATVVDVLWRAGCRHYFVALLEEAIALRRMLPDEAHVFLLNGLLPGAETACAAAGVVPVLNSMEQARRWDMLAVRLGVTLRAALQVDTGMSRLGFSPDEWADLMASVPRFRAVEPVLVMSHLACADEPHHPANAAQLARFERIARDWPGVPLALDNSGGAFLQRSHFDLVRTGIALYGGAPDDGANPMRPVLSLHARIVQVRAVPVAAGVGYGLSFSADRPSRIATIAAGYADGLPRSLGNRGHAFIAGRSVPIVGRVSMDSMTLDVTDVPTDELGEGASVELIGPHQSIDELARDAGTISYEILTRLGRRYAREYGPLQSGKQAEVRRNVLA